MPQFFLPQPEKPKIVSAQQALQLATEKLQAALEEKVDDISVSQALSKAQKEPSRSGELFEMVTEQLLTDDKNQRNTIPGRIGDFMSKMYPIMNLVLGTATTASSVGQRPSVSIGFLGLILWAGNRIRTSHHCSQWG